MTHFSYLLLLATAVACTPQPEVAPRLGRVGLQPCAPLRPTPAAWPHFTVSGPTPIRLRLPANAHYDSAAAAFSLTDSLEPAATASFRVVTADPTFVEAVPPVDRESLAFIDGIPVTPGPRGIIERECALTVAGRPATLTVRHYRHWGDSYSFDVAVAMPRGTYLAVFASAPTMPLRDSMLLVLPTLRRAGAS